MTSTSTSSLVGGLVVLGAVVLAVANPPLGFGGADPSTSGHGSHLPGGAGVRRLDGSAQEAARWVATPENSVHVSGDAIDVGPTTGAAWLAEHGRDFGLCRVYANEPWHFELFPGAPDDGCPRMYADPTEDPRMQ